MSYGKPAEAPEDLPEDIDPFQVASMTPLERSRLLARVVRHYPHLVPLAAGHALPVEAGDVDAAG